MSITIGNVTNRVKSNKQNIKINLHVNSEFEQSNTIKKRHKQNLDKLKTDDEDTIDKGDIMYNEHEVINIPKKLDDLFDNLLCDNYYLYGISINLVSFLNSLLYILLSEFKFKNKKDQHQFSEQLKINLVKELPLYFKNNKYNKLGFKRQDMETNIENNIFENAELHYLSDYYSINLIIIDYYKFTYHTGTNYNDSNNNVIVIKYNDIYLPMIHIFGEFPSNLIYKCIINKLKINNLNNSESLSNSFEQQSTGDQQQSTSDQQQSTSDQQQSTGDQQQSNGETKLVLKALSGYKLIELQDLATKNNIDLKHKDKNKTKKQLYDDLVKC